MKIDIDISAADIAALLHDLPDEAAIRDWAKAMIAGKIENCRKRMAAEGLAAIRRGAIDLATLADLSPATLAAAAAAQPGYKARKARHAPNPFK